MLIELILAKIKIDERQNEQVIVLKEKEGNRYLPVVIGIPEVNAIKLKLSGVEPPRPMTHDLLLGIARGLGAQVRHICIDKLENNTFHAKLVLNNVNNQDVTIDARPSDSIAFALRAACPVYCEETVLEQAGIVDGDGH